jgi:surface polysaccharide O-acyltransferase-like enzyme
MTAVGNTPAALSSPTNDGVGSVLRADGEAVRTGRPRMIGVDAARLVAALGATWLHTADSVELKWTSEFGRFATCFFASMAAVLLVMSLRRRPEQAYGPYILRRFSKLYLAFLVWNVIYLMARLGKHWMAERLGHSAPPGPEGAHFEILWGHVALSGFAHQLWFLPFLVICSIAAFPLVRAVARSDRARLGTAAGLGVFSVVMLAIPEWRIVEWFPQFHAWLKAEGLDYFFNRFWFRLPAFTAGLSVALATGDVWLAALQRPAAGRRRHVFAAVCLLATLSASCLSALYLSDPTSWLYDYRRVNNTIAGLLLVGFALGSWGGVRFLERLSPLARYAFGIYLTHVLFGEAMDTIWVLLKQQPTWWWDLITYAVALSAGLMATWLLTRSRFTAWLIPD